MQLDEIEAGRDSDHSVFRNWHLLNGLLCKKSWKTISKAANLSLFKMILNYFLKSQSLKWAFWTFLSMVLWLGSSDLSGQTINYQGRIVGDDGNPVNASWDVEVNVYESEDSEVAIYTEVVNSVAIKNGLYSFGFGAEGVGKRRQTEILGFGDASTKVFNFTPSRGMIPGSIKISDSKYTWSDLEGASDAGNFIGSVNIPDNNVSAIYFNDAPDHSVSIQLAYSYQVSSLSTILIDHDEAFVQVQVGDYVFPRERLSYTFFAYRSAYSNNELKPKAYRPVIYDSNGTTSNMGPIGAGIYTIPVPKTVISDYSVKISGTMNGVPDITHASGGSRSSLIVTLIRENISTGEVERILLNSTYSFHSYEKIEFTRQVDINKWIDSSDNFSLIIELNLYSQAGNSWFRGGHISAKASVFHN
ncbi:MAG: hypothetical protein ACFHW5_06785 [Verrucomicrobiota bacterium]